MTNMNVSLPEPMREWIEGQIKGGRYGNAGVTGSSKRCKGVGAVVGARQSQ